MEVSSTQETVEPRLLESPVSDSATIGSEAPALIVTGTAIGIAAAATTAAVASKAAAKSPAAKKPVAAAKKTTSTPSKPAASPLAAKPAASPLAAKPAAKDSVKKLEPATRYANK